MKSNRTLSRRVYHITHQLVRLISYGVIAAICAAIYLNLLGVPGPILRKVVRKVNEAGIPVDIERLHLSFYGWKAVNVRYYSKHPDDLGPLLFAENVYVRSSTVMDRTGGRMPGYRLRARGIKCTPSVAWCVGMPEDSMLTGIDAADLMLARSSDRIVLQEGSIRRNGFVIQFNGAITMDDGIREATQLGQIGESLPLHLNPDSHQAVVNGLHALELSKEAVVDIDFDIDVAEPAASRVSLSAQTGPFSYREIPFDRAELLLTYTHPRVQLHHAKLQMNDATFGVEGEYDLMADMAKARIINEITSEAVYSLFPQRIQSALETIRVDPKSFPRFDVQFGPAKPRNLPGRILGTFAVHNFFVAGLELESLSGTVKRSGSRIDVTGLSANVNGQEHRSDEVGSSMVGGKAAGELFVDTATQKLGFTLDSHIDPNLLLEPLADVHVAIDVLSRFRFSGRAPELRTELGVCYADGSDFYIGVQGSAADLWLHDVPLSSLNAASYYSGGVLSFDRLVAKQGIDFLKGSASIDLRNGSADFDCTGTINPEAIENVVYPRYAIFSKTVRLSGGTEVNGRGTVDWRTMKDTSFAVTLEAEEMKLPMATLDGFSGRITGNGPEIKVSDTSFSIYNGTGEGVFSLVLDPAAQDIPYTIDVHLANADFNKSLKYIDPAATHAASGKLSGHLNATAEMGGGFFATANGSGRVDIRHGQLTDLPLFHEFSSLVRRVIPSFKVFSISRLYGDFELRDGVIYSENAYFDGKLISAKGRGKYSAQEGFDAYVQVQTFSEGSLTKVVRFLTDPLLKLFEMRLEGTLKNPEWNLKNFTVEDEEGTPVEE